MEEEIQEVEVSLFDESGKPRADAKVAEVEAPKKDEAPAFEIPDKFKDKSLEDVVQSYVNLEKEYGNKSNEVGELRKLTDQILLNQTQAHRQTPAYEPEINEDVGLDDFINDPSQAVSKALAANPVIQRMSKTLEAQEAQASRQVLLAKHPDADEVVASPEFQSWVQESPGRLQMLQSAHINRNVDVASDMLDLYKQTKVATNEEAVEERGAKAKGALKKATVEVGGAGPTNSKKPIFKRSELIELKLRDPQRYEAMRDVIHEAYADKRVR